MKTTTQFDLRTVSYRPGSSLPQWRLEDAIYFVTFRLADSLPKSIVRDWDGRRRAWLMQALPLESLSKLATNFQDPFSLNADAAIESLGQEAKREYNRLFNSQWHGFLDAGYGACLMRDPAIRKIVSDSLVHFDGTRYELSTSVVMPNHVHALVRPTTHELSDITHSWKSFTANQINKLRKTTGTIWMRESYNRIVRSQQSLEKFQDYVLNNPSNARLPSSAYTLLKSPS